jgi:hypothetical protein
MSFLALLRKELRHPAALLYVVGAVFTRSPASSSTQLVTCAVRFGVNVLAIPPRSAGAPYSLSIVLLLVAAADHAAVAEWKLAR